MGIIMKKLGAIILLTLFVTFALLGGCENDGKVSDDDITKSENNNIDESNDENKKEDTSYEKSGIYADNIYITAENIASSGRPLAEIYLKKYFSDTLQVKSMEWVDGGYFFPDIESGWEGAFLTQKVTFEDESEKIIYLVIYHDSSTNTAYLNDAGDYEKRILFEDLWENIAADERLPFDVMPQNNIDGTIYDLNSDHRIDVPIKNNDSKYEYKDGYAYVNDRTLIFFDGAEEKIIFQGKKGDNPHGLQDTGPRIFAVHSYGGNDYLIYNIFGYEWTEGFGIYNFTTGENAVFDSSNPIIEVFNDKIVYSDDDYSESCYFDLDNFEYVKLGFEISPFFDGFACSSAKAAFIKSIETSQEIYIYDTEFNLTHIIPFELFGYSFSSVFMTDDTVYLIAKGYAGFPNDIICEIPINDLYAVK